MATRQDIEAINNIKKQPKYKSYAYIYDWEQAYFYIRNRATPNHIDINGKTDRIFFRFNRDETYELYRAWLQLKKENEQTNK